MTHKKTIRAATARGYKTDRCGAARREFVYFPNDYDRRKNTNKRRFKIKIWIFKVNMLISQNLSLFLVKAAVLLDVCSFNNELFTHCSYWQRHPVTLVLESTGYLCVRACVIQHYCLISLASASLFTARSPFAVSEPHYVTADENPTFCCCFVSKVLNSRNSEWLLLRGTLREPNALLLTVTVQIKSIPLSESSFNYCWK